MAGYVCVFAYPATTWYLADPFRRSPREPEVNNLSLCTLFPSLPHLSATLATRSWVSGTISLTKLD